MRLRTREDSTVISLRVLRDEQAEFKALCADVGTQPARVLREHFLKTMDELRAESNARRQRHGQASWQEVWDGA